MKRKGAIILLILPLILAGCASQQAPHSDGWFLNGKFIPFGIYNPAIPISDNGMDKIAGETACQTDRFFAEKEAIIKLENISANPDTNDKTRNEAEKQIEHLRYKIESKR
jgi:hypothetical protein